MDVQITEEVIIRSGDTGIKIAPHSHYKALQMTDESVYDLARHYYTGQEIADTFNVQIKTLMARHGDAYRKGKLEGMKKPRMLLNNILEGFMGYSAAELARPDVPVHNLLKAIELHAKKYEGMGAKQTIVHEGVGYDAVESKPLIIEKPAEE
jgi:hypothetical protein